jgi:hypothetical protein
VRAGAAGLDAHVQVELLAQVRDLAPVAQVDPHRAVDHRVLVAAQRALDPGPLLAHERLDVAEGHTPRNHHLDPVGVDDDSRVASAVGAADAVFELR